MGAPRKVKHFGYRQPRSRPVSKTGTFLGGLGIGLLFILFMICAVLLGGLFVYAVWNVFHLAELYDFTFTQCLGLALLLGGAGGVSAGSRR